MHHSQRRQGALWGMLFNSSADLLEIACRERAIRFSDQALLWALASRVKFSTGKIEYRISVLAKRMGTTRPALYASLKRLRAADFVRLGETSGGHEFWMIHPDLFCTGGEDARRTRMRSWNALPRYTPRQRSEAPAMTLQAA